MHFTIETKPDIEKLQMISERFKDSEKDKTITKQDLKTMHELEEAGYADKILSPDEKKFRNKYIQEEMSLQFLVDDGEISEDDKEYADRIHKLLNKDAKAKVSDIEKNHTMKTMMNGGFNDFVQAVLQQLAGFEEFGKYFVSETYLEERDQ